LLRDFEDELEVYTKVELVIKILNKCKLSGNPGNDLLVMYTDLLNGGIVKPSELESVQAWLLDLERLGILSN
jgi:hypothetical protein